MTAYGSVDTAVEAMKRGAYDFVTKPVNIDRLEMLIQRALREREMRRENVELRQQVSRRAGLESMIGHSPAMVEVFRDDQASRSLAGHGAHSRRDGDRQGARRARHSRAQHAGRKEIHRGALQGILSTTS